MAFRTLEPEKNKGGFRLLEPDVMSEEQTPTGLTKLAGEQVLSAVPGGSIASAVLPGLKNVVGNVVEGTPGFVKSTGRALLSPENLVPTVAGIAAQATGFPAPIAAGMAGAGLELAQGATRAEPAKTGREAILRAAIQGVPVVGQFAEKFDVSPEVAGKAALAGVSNVVAEGVGALGLKTAERTFDVSRHVIPGMAESAEKLGVSLDISQRTRGTSPLVSFFKDVAGYGKHGQKLLLQNQLKNREVLRGVQEGMARDFAGSVDNALTREEIGAMLRTDINEIGKTAQEAIERKFYSDLDTTVSGKSLQIDAPRLSIENPGYEPYRVRKETAYPSSATDMWTGETMAPGVPVSLEPLKEAVGKLRIVDRTGKANQLAQNVLKEGRYISFQEAHALRSDLLRLAREGGEMASVAKQLEPALFNTLEDTAKKAGPEVYQQWRKADTFSRMGHDVFDQDVVANLLVNDSKHAEAIGKGIYNNGKVTAIDQLQAAANRAEKLTTQPAYRKILEEQAKTNPRLYSVLEGKQLKASNIMDKARVGWWNEAMDRFGYADPSFPNQRFTDFTQLQADMEADSTKATMKRLFTPEQINRFKEFVNVGAAASKKIPTEVNGFWNLVGRTLESPVSYVAAKAMTNPKAIRFATEGLESIAKGTRQSIERRTAAALRFAALLATGEEGD